MEKMVSLVLLLLLSFGCSIEKSSVQTPTQLTYGTSTQSNANMNYQPQVIIGNQPLGKDSLVATLLQDSHKQMFELSVLEEAVNHELALPGDRFLVVFPPPLNTAIFAAMRVAYPREFLEVDEVTRASLLTFYRQLEFINNNLAQRNGVTLTALSNSKSLITKYDQGIIAGINTAREAAKNLKPK